MIIYSKEHKEIVGHVDGEPFRVLFDEDGYAEVEEAVGALLLQLQAASPVQEETDLDKMNLSQLKRYAKKNGIDLGDATKKADILEKIKGASAGGSAPQEAPLA